MKNKQMFVTDAPYCKQDQQLVYGVARSVLNYFTLEKRHKSQKLSRVCILYYKPKYSW